LINENQLSTLELKMYSPEISQLVNRNRDSVYFEKVKQSLAEKQEQYSLVVSKETSSTPTLTSQISSEISQLENQVRFQFLLNYYFF